MAFVAGVICMAKVIYERKTGIKIKGKIIGFTRDARGNYYPMTEFTYENETYHISGANGSSKPKGKEGDEVEILYRPSNQKYVNIIGSNLDIVISVILMVCGAVMLIIKLGR